MPSISLLWFRIDLARLAGQALHTIPAEDLPRDGGVGYEVAKSALLSI
jgi:hypothetical protein